MDIFTIPTVAFIVSVTLYLDYLLRFRKVLKLEDAGFKSEIFLVDIKNIQQYKIAAFFAGLWAYSLVIATLLNDSPITAAIIAIVCATGSWCSAKLSLKTQARMKDAEDSDAAFLTVFRGVVLSMGTMMLVPAFGCLTVSIVWR